MVQNTAQCTVWRDQWGWSTSLHDLSISQVRKLRQRACVPSAHECKAWIQTQVWLVLKPMFFILGDSGKSWPFEAGTAGDWLPGTKLWVLVWEGGRREYSLGRSGEARSQDTAKASPEVSEGSFRASFFLCRGLVHPGHHHRGPLGAASIRKYPPLCPQEINHPSFPSPGSGSWGGQTGSCVPCLPPRVAEWQPHDHQKLQAGGATSPSPCEGSSKGAVELGPEHQGGAPRQARGKWPWPWPWQRGSTAGW